MAKRKSKNKRQIIDQRFVKALAHELRVQILLILTERIASPKEIAEMLDESLSQVSYHIKVLKDYGRIVLVATEPRRGAVEHYYCATTKTLLPANAWRGVKKGLRAVVAGGLASDLFDDLADALRAEKLTETESHICRLPLVLDAKGWKTVEAIAARATEEVENAQQATAARAAKAKGKASKAKGYTFGLLAFEDSRDLSDRVPPSAQKDA